MMAIPLKMSLKIHLFQTSIRQILANALGVEIYRTVSQFRKRKRKSLSGIHVLTRCGIKQFHVVVMQHW